MSLVPGLDFPLLPPTVVHRSPPPLSTADFPSDRATPSARPRSTELVRQHC